MRFRKKPVVINAVRWLGEVTPELEALFGGQEITVKTSSPPYLSIQTLEGHMLASVGDWIVRGVVGELYPCKHEVFIATYDPVLDSKAPRYFTMQDGGASFVIVAHDLPHALKILVDAGLEVTDDGGDSMPVGQADHLEWGEIQPHEAATRTVQHDNGPRPLTSCDIGDWFSSEY